MIKTDGYILFIYLLLLFFFQAHTLHILGFMSNCHSFKSMFKYSTPRPTWLQTPSHLKRCFSHIRCPNLACYSSLESLQQGASMQQILGFAAKTTRSYTTKPERVFVKVVVSTRLQTPSHLKRCFSHIRCPNLACYSSLEI
jgi:hypothetical protein